MARHKFKVGQLVDFMPFRPGGQASSGPQYEIVRLLPPDSHDSGELQYRVKSKSRPSSAWRGRATSRGAPLRDAGLR